MRRGMLGLLMALCCAWGCDEKREVPFPQTDAVTGKKPNPPPPETVAGAGARPTAPTADPGKPRLTSDAEAMALEKDLLRELAANKGRSCARPVLRGEALAGKATDDMVAVMEGRGELKGCAEGLIANNDAITQALFSPQDATGPGQPARHTWTLRKRPKLTHELEDLLQTCQPVLARIRRAVRHEDACSPYLTGLRGQPDHSGLVRLGRLVALQAKLLLDGGKPKDALTLATDMLRFCQDTARGGSSLIASAVAVAAAWNLLPVMKAVLNSRAPLGEPTLDELDHELAQLIQTQNHPASYLGGEIQAMVTYSILPHLKGEEWSPPGGWGRDSSRDEVVGPPLVTEPAIAARDGMVLSWIAMRQVHADIAAACKPEQVPHACYRALKAMADAEAGPAPEGWDAVRTLRKAAQPDKIRKSIRDKVIAILRGEILPFYPKYIARQGELAFSLAALRVQAKYRALADTQKTCPGLDAFGRSPLKERTTDPYSGKPMVIRSLGGGRFAIRPPVPLGKEAEQEADPAVLIRCPYGRDGVNSK